MAALLLDRLQEVQDGVVEERARRAMRDSAFELMGKDMAEPWAQWLVDIFLKHFLDKAAQPIRFAAYHRHLWRWVYKINRTKRPRPFVGIWPREAGKSTNAEIAVVNIAARGLRKYCIYVCGTQDQADTHVQNVASLLEQPMLAREYPELSERLLSKFGYARGWRINRLRTRSGFTIDAVGLDRAMRGTRIEDARPDFIVFDDVDDTHDTVRTVQRKIVAMSRKIIPAGAANLAILFVQNLIHSNSIASKLLDGSAELLSNRAVSGPHPALQNINFKENADGTAKILSGQPTWDGLNLKRCQEVVDDVGLQSFLVEYQHEKTLAAGEFLGNIWQQQTHTVEPFAIPRTWRVDRSFDWGADKPYCAIWWAEAPGDVSLVLNGVQRTVKKGTLFAIAELYGWNGRPNQGNRDSSEEIARKVQRVEQAAFKGRRIAPGPADSSIYDVTDGDSIADRMARAGIRWLAAQKGPGSRVNGAEAIISRLRAASQKSMDSPALFVFRTCRHILRTFPELPKDPVKDGDVDTTSEDHLWDAARYRVLFKRKTAARRQMALG